MGEVGQLKRTSHREIPAAQGSVPPGRPRRALMVKALGANLGPATHVLGDLEKVTPLL